MNTIYQTPEFAAWLKKLRDQKAKAVIARRIERAEAGNFGDSKSLREGVSEMRIDFGPGYRVYFCRDGETVYILLAGGDKSTQTRDIENAIEMLQKLKDS
ncbi:type II toxin-antitoxin system RelE/ParE family toxin [Robbsia andropogonis]|uniref:type II toxin-antitoxin system RelE/ParE family toxin n=1 Tax=Robbsia andropogonis TaxID=28092 RepID=UPI0004664ADA|nr:type II toxin-antitoxin system RelE/ParE family toxin [Robbsia andropogonis]MCP1121351.1 type II toxin-antitoxin system RelE/ParE family toxin [Robbsia andropogonis]MCP1131156.1 type II toxin-antitoxin system RelE/ParE family toxin [Robbsia andropogonis]